MSFFLNIITKPLQAWINHTSRRSVPKFNGKIQLNGLHDRVEIFQDHFGIPHVYAKDEHDLFFSQGYLHASERFWQMELLRRTAEGRLAEIFGELALGTDCAARTFGFARIAKKDWEKTSSEIQLNVTAYTKGVNAFLHNSNSHLPVEFSLLRFKPADWQELDTMAFVRMMAWQLSHGWTSEIVRARILEMVGSDQFSEIEINYPPENPCTLLHGIEMNLQDENGLLKAINGPFLTKGKGSNAWSLSSTRSATGGAILCNDMHMELGLPGIWYENHLECPEFHTSGVSIPSSPFILSGHNDRIAWGITLAFTDCDDLFMERFDSAESKHYLFGDNRLPIEVVEEEIFIKGKKTPHFEKITLTHHGPIISSIIGEPLHKMALASTSLNPTPTLEGFYRINKAQGWNDFVNGIEKIEAPQLNIVYADTENNIGYWVTGKVPIRAEGDSSVPVPGWTGGYEWIGQVPFEEMPHAFNPQSGYIVSANNKPVDGNYPWFLGNVYMNGYRARRLSELIEQNEKISLEDCRKFQLDTYCLPDVTFSKMTGEFLNDSDPKIRLIATLVSQWDGHLDATSTGGCVIEVFRYRMTRRLLASSLPDEIVLEYMGIGFHPILKSSNDLYGNETPALLQILENKDSIWLKKAGGKKHLLRESLKETAEWCEKNLGLEPKDWNWGKIHTITLRHAMGIQKPLDLIFNRGPFPIGGNTDTPLQTAMSPAEPYALKFWGPSMRHLINMKDFSKSLFILPSGQSGHVGSPHYDDMTSLWLQGEVLPMFWERSDIENNCNGILVLDK